MNIRSVTKNVAQAVGLTYVSFSCTFVLCFAMVEAEIVDNVGLADIVLISGVVSISATIAVLLILHSKKVQEFLGVTFVNA